MTWTHPMISSPTSGNVLQSMNRTATACWGDQPKPSQLPPAPEIPTSAPPALRVHAQGLGPGGLLNVGSGRCGSWSFKRHSGPKPKPNSLLLTSTPNGGAYDGTALFGWLAKWVYLYRTRLSLPTMTAIRFTSLLISRPVARSFCLA